MSRKIADQLRSLLLQLQHVLSQLDDEQYGRSIAILSDASLGQDTRHVLEFLIELQRGYERGSMNYDSRERNKEIKRNRALATAVLASVSKQLDRESKLLTLTVGLASEDENPDEVATNFEHELVYNLEHVVHHMALMRIGIIVVSDLSFEGYFWRGVSQPSVTEG